MQTIKDFDSREDFVRSLNLFHYDLDKKQTEFCVVNGLCDQNFLPELQHIKHNLKAIQDQWNNQSIDQIEQSVSKFGTDQLEIMQGQKNDKIRAGYLPDMPMYRVRQCDPDSVFYKLAESLGLEYAVARYHVQFPGEVTSFHTDIFSPAHDFLPAVIKDIPTDKIGHDNNIRRILIALEDWQWGQVIMFGASTWHQWKSGDIAYWNYGVPHCAANMGHLPRISASITGLATDEFFKKFNYE
jgi:hypothetical protein